MATFTMLNLFIAIIANATRCRALMKARAGKPSRWCRPPAHIERAYAEMRAHRASNCAVLSARLPGEDPPCL
ncbi:MAG: hypothetical protein R3E68_00630 [Burkholderiaceae bacterium]